MKSEERSLFFCEFMLSFKERLCEPFRFKILPLFLKEILRFFFQGMNLSNFLYLKV